MQYKGIVSTNNFLQTILLGGQLILNRISITNILLSHGITEVSASIIHFVIKIEITLLIVHV